MRLTTKIIIGIISFIFLSSLIFIIGFSFSDRVNYEAPVRNGYSGFWLSEPFLISQENKTAIHVNPYKTIVIEKEKEEKPMSILVSGTIRFSSVSEENELNSIILSEEMKQYTELQSSNDTLRIIFKIKDIYERYKSDEFDSFYVNNLDLQIPSSNVDVVCKMSEIAAEINNVNAEKIQIDTKGKIRIDSCKAALVQPKIRGRNDFKIRNSRVNELNIDLDYIDSWKVENCSIAVKNLTGSGNKKANLNKYESMELNWLPKDRHAILNLTLYGDTSKVVVK